MSAVPQTEASLWWTPSRDEDRFLPEGPRLISINNRQAIAWVNIQTAALATTGAIHLRYLDNLEHQSWSLPGRPGFLLATDLDETLLLGMETEVGLFHLRQQRWQPLARLTDAHPRTIINDGEPLPDGTGVIFGTKDLRFSEPIGELVLFTLADRRLTRLAGGQICSNGKVFVPGNSHNPLPLTLYDIDSPKKCVVRYRVDLEQRQLISEGVAIDLRESPSFPDGMCLADDESVIIAFYHPDAVAQGRAGRYRLDTGEVVEEWLTPGSPRVTCPLLLPSETGVQLLLTTATEGMPESDRRLCPNAGCLFLAATRLKAIRPTEVVRFR
jgi:sugar lactone lactonase YvrE